ncbi:MAG: neuraminidase-like domain-containing protein, partial [Longimicrobiales bacterium]
MFSIDGRVIALGPGAGDVAGLTILAVDTLEGTPAVAITAITTTEGTFSLTLELGDLIHLFRGDPRSEPRVLERVASLHLSILRNGTTLALHDVSFTLVDLLDPTHRVELSVPAGGDTPGRGDRGRDACRYFVRGNLRQTDGTPVPSALVEVVEQRLRTEAMLGEARTSDAGAYEVAYGSPAPCNPARPGKNLFARAFGAQGEELALSRLHCDVPADVRIDLVVGEAGAVVRGPSRYVQVRDVVTPRLEGVELHELTADDVEHLACVTQQDVVHVAYLARSAQLEVETGVTSVAFFAFANAGLPTKLVGVLGQDRETLAAALTRGEADNVVPPWREGQVESILDAFHEALLERSVPRADPAASLLGELLLTGGVARSLPREFIEAYVAREGTVQEFWEGFRAERGVSTVNTVQFTLAIGSLTGNHIPLVESLQSRRAAHEVEHARDLARLTVTDWLDVLTSGPLPPGAPAAIPGETQEEKNEKYAATLQRVFEDAFPTMAVAGALARAGILHGVDEFVSLNPAFDLGATRIDAFLEGNPNLPSADPEELRRDLKHVQRLHAIAPRLGRGAAVTALLRQNIISAQHVYKLGYASFTHRFEGVMSNAERELVWRKATQQAHKVLAVAARYGSPSNVPAMPVIAAHIPEPDDGFPDISSLFGAQDFCACEHCRGVFSPAAYLTDLLSFLRDQPAAQDGSFADGTLLDVIEARREDLVHVLLNCDNAHVPLPTIDLVNELLERRVSPPQPSDWADLQTTWTADELRAHPEHVHQPAYDTLEEALHPFILPFDLRLEEARLYLDHLGVRLADLLDVLKGHSEASTDIQALARETLRLSRMQGEIVENDFSDTPQPQALWGLGASWASDLNGDVRLFLKQASLSYEELLELLHVDYVCMPAGTVEIEHAEGKPCTLEDASFDDWNGGGTSAETRLGRAQRFIRLARRMGWSFFDLDAAVRALSTVEDPLEDDAVDGAWLRRFAGVVRLLERWPQLAKLELLSWFGTLDTRSGRHGEPSFYARLFLDRTLDPDNEDFGLDAESAELENTDALDPSTDGPVLQAVLNLRDGELEALLEALDAFVGATPQRDLSWLSRLYRRASLSRALGMSMSELLRVASLLGEEPFADGAAPQPDVAHTRAFLERVDRVNATRFTLAELDYLLRHRFDASEGVALLRDRQQEIFVELIRGLQDIEADTSRGTDEATPALTALGDRLGEVIAEAFIQTTLLLIETADIEGANAPALRAELEQFLSTDEVDTLFEEPESAADPRTAAQRAEDTLVTLLEHVRRTQMAAVVVQKLSEAVGIATGAGVALLRQIEVNGDDGVTLFSQDAFVHAIDFEADAEAIKTAGFPELTPANVLDDHFETLERLHKAALVVRRFGLNVRNLEWLLERAESLDLLSPLDLPTGEPVDGPAPQWARWEKLARVVLLRDAVFRDPDALFDLLATADDENSHLNEESQALLVEGTGWDADDLRHLVEHTEESLDIDAASIVAVDGLERLARAFRMLRRLGVSADRATAWATTDVTPELARAIKSATRSKHAPQQWPAVIGPLRDALREQQRDALVAQVLAQSSELREPDDLLGELLIDVQGAACQRTSRIVQASAAVQLFVQRMLMDLEQPERLDDRAAREWVWRKFYRVWEANRKVFLYPENFVEPELRDDQSPLFRELTADLMDADLTPERAERAYVSFLRKIKEVARLEAAGIYHQVEYGQYADPNLGGLQTLNILHVFARTMSPPYRYFYRRWVNETYWTAWEEIPLGIEHPTVMPALHHRRLLLMWPMFTEAAVKPTGGSDNARPYVEIQLAFSEYVDGAWTQSRLSEETTPALRLRSEFIGTLTSGPEMGLQLGLLDDEATRFPAGIFFETLVDEHKLVVQPMFFAEARLVPVGGLADPAAIAQLGVFLTTPHAFHFIGSENKVIRVDAEAEVRPGDWPSAHPRPNLSGIRHQYFNLSRQSFDANEHPATREFRLFRPGFFNDVVMTPRLVRAASPYEVLAPRHNTHGNAVRFLAEDPFFYHDDRRAFFVWPRDPNEIGLPSFEGDESDLSD